MKMIRTENITKKYKRYKKQEGVTGSIKGLFHREYEEKIAVDAFNMDVDEGEFIGL
ncbi:MAG: multidrug ABC transporter ATP-binding protein, partial [Dorea sp.]|nr:multidrug ABC transporter ATP-binding protein [Dorea sp.]